METRSPTWRTVLMPLAFGLACVVLSIIAWRAFDGTTPLQPKRYEFYAELPSAAGLVPGADVRTAGVVVGEIAGVRRAGDRARVTASMETRFAPVRTRAVVVARTKSLLGEAYLELAPGPRSAPWLEEGGTLARSQIRPTRQLAEVLSTFSPQVRADTRRMFDGLATGLRGRGGDLNDALGWSAQASADVSTLFGQLDRQRGELQALLRSSGEVFDAVGVQQAAVRETITAGRDVLTTTADRDRALRASVRALPPFLGELRRTATTLDAASGELNAAMGSLEPVAPDVAPLLRDLERYAPSFTALFRALPPVLDGGRRNLRYVGQISRAARPALAKAYPAFRELIPFMQLLGANRDEVVAVLGNVGSLLNGRMFGPGNRLVSYGTGIPTVWNEVIGGWVRKLPTNRANAYPKPGGLRSLGERGVVEAYDCRHTGNPLIIPATGSGAPPCLTQGPWSFQGKERSYPNLEPAAP